MNRITAFLILVLLTASWLWPSEAASEGQGLHLTALWLLLAAVHPLIQARSRSSADCRFSPAQKGMAVGILLLVGGYWLSTWHVFAVQGDRRAALNLAFEWTGIAAAWWLLSRLAAFAAGRRNLATLLTGLAAGLAVLGIWQHHWLYAAQAQWYQNLTGSLQQASQDSGVASALEAARIRADLQQQGVPLDGSSKALFEQRLLASSEPYGTFALANTLAGVLAVAWVVLVGHVALLRRDSSSPLSPPASPAAGDSASPTAPVSVSATSRLGRFSRWLGLLAVAILIGYCLMLTKSRTAWVGATVGTVTVLFSDTVIRHGRRWWLLLAAGLAVLLAAAGIGFASGALDREVILEAPRSLQFRLFYWTGTWGVIREQPVVGSGPGNFRQYYLAHKPVESSEEILDPHNLLLDAWASAGLPGLIGLLTILVAGIGGLRSSSRQMPAVTGPNLSAGLLVTAVAGGWGLHGLVQEVNGAVWDDVRLMTLAVPGLAVVVVCLAGHWLGCRLLTAAAALLTFATHLLGAGGLHVSVVGLLLVVLASLAAPAVAAPTVRRAGSPLAVAGRAGLSVVFAGMLLAVIFQGLIPVRAADYWLSRGSQAYQSGDLRTAANAWEQAAAADTIAVIPRQRLAELQTYRLMAEIRRVADEQALGRPYNAAEQRPESLADVRQAALAASEDFIRSDLRRTTGYHLRGRQHRLLAELTENLDTDSQKGEDQAAESVQPDGPLSDASARHLQQAIADQQRVLQLYPTAARYWLELAELQHVATAPGQAAVAAEQALRIDQINRQWGHQDRFLSPEELVFLKSVIQDQ